MQKSIIFYLIFLWIFECRGCKLFFQVIIISCWRAFLKYHFYMLGLEGFKKNTFPPPLGTAKRKTDWPILGQAEDLSRVKKITFFHVGSWGVQKKTFPPPLRTAKRKIDCPILGLKKKTFPPPLWTANWICNRTCNPYSNLNPNRSSNSNSYWNAIRTSTW